MFYCDKCANEKGYPLSLGFKSFGSCEICKKERACNDITSKYLPTKKENKNDTKEKPTLEE